mmetsp:Transcript_59741/g.185380  ORF Transcript_59741/g.185380 Transcript_59741/m.185380 type:complete len:295 (+) Transcript_59741:109-993(+)
MLGCMHRSTGAGFSSALRTAGMPAPRIGSAASWPAHPLLRTGVVVSGSHKAACTLLRHLSPDAIPALQRATVIPVTGVYLHTRQLSKLLISERLAVYGTVITHSVSTACTWSDACGPVAGLATYSLLQDEVILPHSLHGAVLQAHLPSRSSQVPLLASPRHPVEVRCAQQAVKTHITANSQMPIPLEVAEPSAACGHRQSLASKSTLLAGIRQLRLVQASEPTCQLLAQPSVGLTTSFLCADVEDLGEEEALQTLCEEWRKHVPLLPCTEDLADCVLGSCPLLLALDAPEPHTP